MKRREHNHKGTQGEEQCSGQGGESIAIATHTYITGPNDTQKEKRKI